VGCPVGQNDVTLALASLSIGFAAVVADKGRGVGLRQPFGLPVTSERSEHCLRGSRPAIRSEAEAREAEQHHRPFGGLGNVDGIRRQ